jgi:prepilin-type N-terminal cleavage/methylation domain-containing protein
MTKKGFTLIELMVVISIIGVLSSIVVASLSSAKANSRDAKRISDIKTIQVALALYYGDYLKYPITLSALEPNYLAKVPKDPSNTANGGAYFYAPLVSTPFAACNQIIKYHLAAVFENSNNSQLQDDADRQANSAPGYSCSTGFPDFPGDASPDCASNGGTDFCYDVVGN